ncbi:hypothetical protein [uncultured Pedobacter sp.]|uniref:hypothetical protein n=1 Tax=uncultured Pedobacter sp. TaxID=246139 RepID=UPI0025DE2AAB|nr:hypothetical protein [uncultured Pedobacter sp.]
MKPDTTKKKIINNAAELWTNLKSSAGLDTVFYDKDLIRGTEEIAGLYQILGLKESSIGFEQDLNLGNISVSRLLVALFSLLQPYAGMMEELCMFFEKHGIKEGKDGIKISFDFSATGAEELKFDLNHFREILKTFREIEEKVSNYQINSNTLFELNETLRPNIYPQSGKEPQVS